MSYLEKVDRYLDSLKVGKSAMVDSWFMMSSPMPIVAVVVAYLLFIRIGPRFMENRPPLRMNKLISYYNAFQVLLAAMICVKVFKLNIFRDGIMYAGCRYPSHTQNPMLLDVGWWYFFAKFTELLDTVFFVLRKKDKQVNIHFTSLFVLSGSIARAAMILPGSQITFLHVYHHVIMAFYSWSYLKFAAGGEGAILALLNSIVHVVMYSYYLLSGLGPRFQKYLWWKKYVTRMQLMQFTLMLAYCAVTHFSSRCQYAAGFTYFISANVTVFMFLFLNFYTKNYKKQRDAAKEIKEEFERTHNGFNQNGVTKPNGIAKDKPEEKENGMCGDCCKGIPNLEEIPYEINDPCGDCPTDNKVFLTRRTAKAPLGPEYDFNSIIKK